MIIDSLTDFKATLEPRKAVMALDVGTAKIGIAISDRGLMIANGKDILKRLSFTKDTDALLAAYDKYEATGLVVGWPLQPDGTEGKSCEMVQKLITKLLAIRDVPIFLADERYSTSAANELLQELGMSRKKRNAIDDKVAASFILQGILDRL